MGAAGEPTRAARLYLRVVRNELDRLGRLRNAPPTGDGEFGTVSAGKRERAALPVGDAEVPSCSEQSRARGD